MPASPTAASRASAIARAIDAANSPKGRLLDLVKDLEAAGCKKKSRSTGAYPRPAGTVAADAMTSFFPGFLDLRALPSRSDVDRRRQRSRLQTWTHHAYLVGVLSLAEYRKECDTLCSASDADLDRLDNAAARRRWHLVRLLESIERHPGWGAAEYEHWTPRLMAATDLDALEELLRWAGVAIWDLPAKAHPHALAERLAGRAA